MSNVENLEDHMAFACDCGCVGFNLLKSGGLECESCGTVLKDCSWGKAIEQAQKQEPVAWATREDFYRELDRSVNRMRQQMEIKGVVMRCADYDVALPIIDIREGHVLVGQVTSPPPHQPLTDEEIDAKRWAYVLKRADEMKISRYNTLVWLLGLSESEDDEEAIEDNKFRFDLAARIDRAITAHGIKE